MKVKVKSCWECPLLYDGDDEPECFHPAVDFRNYLCFYRSGKAKTERHLDCPLSKEALTLEPA